MKIKTTVREHRRALLADAMPEIRKLVKKYDLASVNAVIKSLYDERKASKELHAAEAKVNALKKRLGV